MDNFLIAKRIKDKCKEKKITIKNLIESCNLNRNFIYDLEKKNSSLSSDKIFNISNFLNCSSDYILGIDNLSNNINFKYKLLDDKGKEAVIRIISNELKRIENTKNIIDFENPITIEPSYIESIKTYELSTSAGTGTFITDDVPFHFEQVNLRTTPQARRADFAVYVRGDSMEPNYFDGDMVFVKEQPAINNGEIGIFIYNDESYIKKYEVRKDGAYLVSLNKEYPPIKMKQSYNFKCCGLVL